MIPVRFDLKAPKRRMRSEGWWDDRHVDDLLTQALGRCPEKTALIAYRADRQVRESIVATAGPRPERAKAFVNESTGDRA